jgi:SAM-dependent methyltransferase
LKEFYDRHHGTKATTGAAPTVEESLRHLRARGSRYFCVFDQIAAPASLDAIELGFGYPQISNALASVFRTYRAIDVAAETILAKYPGPISFEYLSADLNKDFPVPDESVDVVIAMMVIEHLFDPFHSFSEVARICRKGGIACVNLPLVTSIKNRLNLLAGRLPMTSTREWFEQREWDGGHLHYFDIAHVRRLAALYDLTLKRIYPVGRGYALKSLAPGLLCGEASFVFSKQR